ncbi:hypothetical protein KVR01_013713 [Diaporthe batatas]|uniref:uncharacterized protein n=1 Tax=Diaporthe batatas TaxID=748121 RepID=UPI001D03630C|nr:uncharacterized protein KVR01_013713 [Diaporthe batatas]KAG8156372.1 hypothetical protein KVR01_013713 [Diaporthe batatas]
MAALRSAFSQLRDILSLAHLITESNIKAFVTPTVLNGLMAAASGGVTTDVLSWPDVAVAVPKMALYIWLWDLYFDCSNQKDPGSIEEDRLNKPWRAIPSGRLSVEAAERWYVCSACIMPAVALWLGALPEAIAFMLETQVYDRLGGGSTWWGRSIINPLFFSTAQLGAIRVAAGTSTTVSKVGYQWCMIHALIIFTTIHLQDLRDLDGDKARGRNTLPLALGEGATRVLMSFFVFFWSFAAPAWWACSVMGYLVPGLIGTFVAGRFLLCKTRKADHFSFHLYALLWLPSIYSTPLFSQAVATAA